MSQGRGPNILLIISDQHGARWNGCYGNSLVRTPAIDALAREAVVFDNAYCNSPLCVPSRMSFLTGRRVQDIEIWDNHTQLPPGTWTWPRALVAAGYEVVLDGKMHIAGPDRLQGFQRQLSRDVDNPLSMPVPDWRSKCVPGVSFSQVDEGFADTPEGFRDVDDEVADAAVEFLESKAGDRAGRPWVLVVGFHGPHPKWIVEKEYLDMYPEASIPDPDFPWEHLHRQNPVHIRRRVMRGSPPTGDPPDKVRRARRYCFAKITRTDDRIGRVVSAFSRLGFGDDSYLVYTSDHGEMAGEHGLWNKHCFYEESAGIPMIIRRPKAEGAGTRRAEMVSLLDLSMGMFSWGTQGVAPTPAGVVGGPTSGAGHAHHGDIFALVENRIADWENVATSEYYGTWLDRPTAMLRRDQYKITLSPNDPPELYDLEKDPRELHDLSDEASFAAIRDRLSRELLSQWDPVDLHRRVVESQDSRRHLWPPKDHPA